MAWIRHGYPMIGNHDEAVRYFNRLVIDLMLELDGLDHEPITKERLREATRHIRDIQECCRPAIVRYAGGGIDAPQLGGKVQ